MEKEIKIALAGNPNSGKTTLFNLLTGSNSYVGNWPGVTVEKKEGKFKKDPTVTLTDLPGIYSLSPYTEEEVVARNYLVIERPDAILNIVDGTNIERNLYLTTQLMELGIPVVIAINMLDIIRKNGDKINTEELGKELGCPVVEISALKEEGIDEATDTVIKIAREKTYTLPHIFSGTVEHALAHIEEAAVHGMEENTQRWYSIKLFERDHRVRETLKIDQKILDHIENDIKEVEEEEDDDAEAIITNERYIYVGRVLKSCYKKKSDGPTLSDKIDSIVTNRFLALPIFALIMFLVFFISISTIGGKITNWVNDGVFGSGWHLFGIGSKKYKNDLEKYNESKIVIDAFADKLNIKKDSYSLEELEKIMNSYSLHEAVAYNLDGKEVASPYSELVNSIEFYSRFLSSPPIEKNYGVFIPSIPDVVRRGLEKINTSPALIGIIVDGIITGVGAVLGFLPELFLLFICLSLLEDCGYMSRIAFVLDRIFRKFGLSGKSFIPILVGVGCGVPGIMASRTIENINDRRMTVMTTTFMPCSAKLPVIALIAGSLFGGKAWVAPLCYFVGLTSIICSGIILKKTKMFQGETTPFVMELPSYHAPKPSSIAHTVWERTFSYIKKAGTIILLSSVLIYVLSFFGYTSTGFRMLKENELSLSLLSKIGSVIAVIFIPLGWGNWRMTTATITGLVAKENIVSTLSILFGTSGNLYNAIGSVFTPYSALSFLMFNLLCIPCFASVSAIRREMNSLKWTSFALFYQFTYAYFIAFVVNQVGAMFSGVGNIPLFVIALLLVGFFFFMLFRKERKKG